MKHIYFLFFAFCVLLGQGGHASLVIGDFDKRDRAESARNSLGDVEKGNVTKITDQKLQETRFVLDELDRVIEAINPLSLSEKSRYDEEENLIEFTTKNLVTILYRYNDRNELIGKTVSGIGDLVSFSLQLPSATPSTKIEIYK